MSGLRERMVVNMKKHRYKTVLSVFFALLLILSTVSLAVYAAEASALSAELITDKEEYAESEDISVTLRIKNTGENKLINIAYSLTAPDGYQLKSGSLKGTEDELGAGGVLSYDNVFSAVIDNNKPDDPVKPDKPDDPAKPDEPITPGNTDKPDEPGNTDKPASPDTGVTVNPVIPLITAVICAVALLILNKKKAKNLLALVLCASLLSSALPLDVAADEINANIARSADITVTKDVTAGGVKKTFTARVTAGEYGGNVTVTYDAQGGKEIDSLTLPVGETVGRLPDTVKEGAVHNGWYLDKECTEQFYEDEPVMQDITLYAGYDEDGIKPETPEYNEITISDAPEDFSFSLISQSGITSTNLQDIISIECEYGDMPQFDVENTASGTYTVKPSEGWTAGGAYVLSLIDNNVRFSGINSDILPDEQIKTITLFIYREETNNVKLKDGIITIPSGRITEDEDSEYIRISKDEFETLGIENGTVIFSDNAQDSEKSRYMNVISYELVGDEYKILVESSDVDDIYDELDIYFSEKYVDNEVLAESVDTEELVAKLYDGEGTQQLTYMLAAALYDSKTVNELGDGSAPFELLSNTYMDGVDWNDKQIKLNIKELLEGLTISAKVGTAKNSNFSFINGFPNEQDWTALNITFSYEVTLKNKVKLDAEVAISEYFIIGVGGSVNSKRDFNAKFLPLSQTDVSFKILVSSADEEEDGNGNNNNSEENKRDVSVEIEAILNGEDKDSSNIIKDVQEMLDSKGGAIRLCEVNLFSATFMPIFPLSVKMELNFVVNVSFAAGISMEASILQAKGIGIRGNIKNPSSINVYRFIMAGDDRYIFDMYAYGYLGVEAGIEGKVSVSLLGLNDLGSVGAALEIGAYADLYGYLHYHSQDMRMNKYYASPKENYSDLQGGIYFEMGIYIKISVFAESKLFNKKAELAKQFKFPLFGVGDKYIYADKPTLDGNTDIILRETDTNVYEIDGLIPAQGTYLDITTGDVVTRQMNSNEFKAACYSKYFKVTKNDSGRITLTVSPDAPSKYTSGLLSCILRVYYTGGQNLLFTSDTEKLYYDADKGTYVSRKYIGDVNVYYYRNGVDFPLEDKDKTATLKFAVSADGKTEIVDTVTVQKGGYVSGFSLAVANYCNSNGYIYDTSLFDTEIKPYYWLSEDTVITLNTHTAQKLYSVEYFDSGIDKWVSELWATDYLDDIKMFDRYKAPVNSITHFANFGIDRADGMRYQMYMKDSLTYRYYDSSYSGSVYGLDTTKPLAVNYGSEEELLSFRAEYEKQYPTAYSIMLKANYLSRKCIIDIYNESGYAGARYVAYGDEFTVPDTFIDDLNSSKDKELVGWDIDGDGNADIAPDGKITVKGDMRLKPVMKKKLYTVTVRLADYTERKFDVIYGKPLPQELDRLINSIPENPKPDSEDSFYEPSYVLIKSDVAVGGYTAGETVRYNGDISIMPEGNMYFEIVPAKLYHYITLIANDGGGFRYTDENGAEIESDRIRTVVRDGYRFATAFYGYSAFAPEDTYTTEYLLSYFVDADGNKIDTNDIVKKPGTYYMKWNTNDRRCRINYDVYIYNEHGAEVSHEIKAEFEGYRPDYDELCKRYDAEVAALTSYEDEYYTYTLKEEPVNDENTTDDGKTYKTITVKWDRAPKEFDVTFDYDNGTENETVKVKYGYLYQATASVTKDDKYNDYELAGYDLDGDGNVDVQPGESFRVTGDMNLKAIWSATYKLYSIVFYAMAGTFEDGTVRHEITGKYGDTIPQSDIPVPTAPEGYEFAGWDKAVPTTFGNDDGILKTELKATYKLKKMTITYRLVNLDTNKVYESYKTAEFDYGTVFTADMLEVSPDTDGCLFSGWFGENGYSVIGKEIKSDMTLTGTITPVYVIYSLDGVESSREKAKIGSEVTVKEKSDGYLDWTTEDVTVASGKFTMPSKNVAFTAEKDLSGYLTVSDGSASTIIDTESKTFISNKASGFEYDTATGILTVTENGLKLSGVGKNIMLYIKQSVSDITFENLTLTAGDMNGVKPDDFGNSGSIGDEQGSADTYLMFVSSNSLKVNVNGNVTLSKRNTATTANLLAIYQSHLDYTDATPMSMEFVGGDSPNFTVTGNTYAIQSMGSVDFSDMTFTAAAEYYGVHAETIRFDRCSIITTGLAGTNIESSTGIYSNDLSIVDCSLDIRTGIFGETIDISGATDGKVTSGYGGAVMVKCKTAGWSETASGLLTVALDKGHSVLFTVSAGNSAIQAFDFEGGENKVVSYPQTTVPDKEFELTKDFYWLLKEKNGSALINEITFSGK